MAFIKKTQNANQRRDSLEGGIKTTDPIVHILDEIRKMRQEMKDLRQEMKDDLKESIQEIREEIKEVRTEMRKDLKKELDIYGKKMEKMTIEIRNTQKELQEIRERTKELEDKSKKNIDKQEQQQYTELNNELRYREKCIKIRGIQEKINEDLLERILPDLAKYLGLSESIMEMEIDKIFRVNSTQAREKKVPRDVVVCLVRSKIRDLIIQKNYNTKLYIEGEETKIFKDLPPQILAARNKYKSLTQTLTNLDINYKWERIEGLTFFHNQKRFKIDNEKKAAEAERKLREKYKDREERNGGKVYPKREWRNRNNKKKDNDNEEEIGETSNKKEGGKGKEEMESNLREIEEEEEIIGSSDKEEERDSELLLEL